jgi:hypothetical protein
MEPGFALAMAGAAFAHQTANASHKETSQQRAGRTRRTSADPQRAQQGATAAAADAPASLNSLSRLQQLANASPQVAQLRRLQALADARFAPVAQLAGGPEEEELDHGKFGTAQLQPQLQQAPRANNTGLPDNLKAGVESLSGMSLDHVRVHYNSPQPAQLNALAYAQGSDIHLAPGQEQHLPHEAWHVVQQAQGRVRPTMQMAGGLAVNDDAGLEREADVMGARMTILKPQTDQRYKLEHARTPSDAALRAKANTKHKSGGENTQFMCFIAQFNKGKKSPEKVKKTKKKFKTTLTVRNKNDSYETGWLDQLSRSTGVETGPREEAKKLGYILNTKCIGGHMINDQMGGGGGFDNIIPITVAMNRSHTEIENMITSRFSSTTKDSKLQFKYKMVVSERKSHDTDRGKVSNWPTKFVNSYKIRSKVSEKVLYKGEKECSGN